MSGVYKNVLNSLAVFSITALSSLVIFGVASPVISTNASDVVSELNVNVEPNITMALTSDTISLNITPTLSGASKSDSTVATISTNNKTGYSLYINTDKEDLIHTDPTVSSKIASIATAGTLASISNNTWGYSLDNTTFSKVPTTATKIASSTKPTASDSTSLYVGSKVDTNIAAGTYTGTVKLSAVTNYVAPVLKTIYDITYMQQMTSTICQNTTTPLNTATTFATTKSDDNTKVPQVVLTDARDNKKYIIRKLADGNCWMTQNLALEGGTTITPTDSNVTANYTLPVSSTNGFDDNTKAFVYNGTHIDGVNDTDTTNTGGYYSYVAATAGTGNSVTTQFANTNQSICPRGWKLPSGTSSETYDSTNTGDMWKLYQAYEPLTVLSTSSMNANFKNAWSPTYVGDYDSSSLYGSGITSYWWSSTTYSSTRAYGTDLNTSGYLYPGTGYSNHYYGFSVRCVAQ